MTDPLGQSQVLPYIIGLSKKGYKFHLVSFEKPNRFKQNRKVIERICSENEIEWHPLMYTKRPPFAFNDLGCAQDETEIICLASKI